MASGFPYVDQIVTEMANGAYAPVIVTVPYNVPVDQNIFIAGRAFAITAVRHVPTVVGSDGGSVTAQVRKCTGTQAPASGAAVTTAEFNLKSTVNTNVNGTLTTTQADLVLAVGDRLALDVTGTTTAAVGVIQIELRPI